MAVDPDISEELIRLHNNNASIRLNAVTALRDRMDVSEVVHAMRVLIYDPDGHVRILAAEALARQGLYASEALPVLITVLEVVDEADVANVPHAKEWRRVAAGVIRHYGAEGEPAVAALRNALLDPDHNVRGYAAISLGAIGPAAIAALQDLRAARQAEANAVLRQVYEQAIRDIVGSDHFIVIRRDDEGPPSVGRGRIRG